MTLIALRPPVSRQCVRSSCRSATIAAATRLAVTASACSTTWCVREQQTHRLSCRHEQLLACVWHFTSASEVVVVVPSYSPLANATCQPRAARQPPAHCVVALLHRPSVPRTRGACCAMQCSVSRSLISTCTMATERRCVVPCLLAGLLACLSACHHGESRV